MTGPIVTCVPGKELLHGLRHEVSGGVADHLETIRRVGQHRLDGRIRRDRRRKIDEACRRPAPRPPCRPPCGRRRASTSRADEPTSSPAVASTLMRGTRQSRASAGRPTPRHGRTASGIMVGTGGIEPPTSSVSGKRSPTELRAFVGLDRAVPSSARGVGSSQRICLAMVPACVKVSLRLRPGAHAASGAARLVCSVPQSGRAACACRSSRGPLGSRQRPRPTRIRIVRRTAGPGNCACRARSALRRAPSPRSPRARVGVCRGACRARLRAPTGA